ncbi:hypothetical protein [Halobacterium wangiae]|uniref:hypothetical protein n=1 Tax=Halobacterium wangiae TaxID=2902623 RepID=UPI001E5E62FD|nr:hypothetical protein [Halobacterium wangiae]
MTIEIEPLGDGDALAIRDAAEGEQFVLRTDRHVDPSPASPDEFGVPVDAAVAIEAETLHLPQFGTAEFLADGEVVHRTESPDTVEVLDRGTYEVDVSPPVAKTYVKVCGASVAARYTDDHLYLDVAPATRLVVGVRSHHERPAATVTTTDDPRDLMRAVSTFGSALKTHTPDRSWPTLRGHPPEIERGIDLDVPDAVAPPDTGVTLEVPPEYGPIYTVAPLAYYLGATVESGTEPTLRAAGHVHEFDPDAFVADVRDCLEHVFTLDGVVRSTGRYPFRSTQADTLDERVTIDYEALFESPLDERTAAYLDVPRSATEGLVDWHVTADVAPDPAYASVLPYVVNELAIVRSPPPPVEQATLSPSPDALSAPDASDVRAPSVADASSQSTGVVVPDDPGTPGHVWAADGFAVDAANPTLGSFRRALDWPSGTDPLDVHVVYNDARIDDPDETPYGFHPTAETTVRTSHSLTTGELREALHEDTDFLHFVGHVTDSGMVCPDGQLDVRTLVGTGVSAFFLNGCRSYEQGYALLTAGSVAGIVTVDDVLDANASRFGRQAAMLLDAGFPMYAVLDVLEDAGLDTSRYTILGSSVLALRAALSGAPVFYDFDTADFAGEDAPFPLTTHDYPYGANGLGAFVTPNHTTADNRLLAATERSTNITREELERYLRIDPMPTLVDGALRLTDDLSMEEFR